MSAPVACAELASCLAELARRHEAAYASWRDGAGQPPRVAAVSFDLDDTLWPTMPPLIAAQAVREAALKTHLPSAYEAGALSPRALRAKSVEVSQQEPLLAHDFTAMQRVALASLATEHGEDDPTAVDAVLDAFLHARSDTYSHWYADAAPALHALRSGLGLMVGSITNGNCDVRRHADLSRHFDFAITAAEAGASKPHIAPFLFAAAAAGCRPSELVHVGDDNSADLEGALAAGCRAILVTRPRDESADAPGEQGRKGDVRAGDAATLPAPDDSRWRSVASLAEAVDVIRAWKMEDLQGKAE